MFAPSILVTHRWIGLGSALILAVVGGTGAVLVSQTAGCDRSLGTSTNRSASGRWGTGSCSARLALPCFSESEGSSCGGGAGSRRSVVDLGWRRALADLHHVTGLAFFVVMLTLAVTGITMPFVTPDDSPDLRQVVMALHTSGPFPWPIGLLYQVCTLGFIVQGVTGVVMWWTPDRRPARVHE